MAVEVKSLYIRPYEDYVNRPDYSFRSARLMHRRAEATALIATQKLHQTQGINGTNNRAIIRPIGLIVDPRIEEVIFGPGRMDTSEAFGFHLNSPLGTAGGYNWGAAYTNAAFTKDYLPTIDIKA